jgi:hypothetical protein
MVVYVDYKVTYLDNILHEGILKDQLQKVLKELKTRTYNGERDEKVFLQNEKVLAQLKATNAHVIDNDFKRRQNIMMGHLVINLMH